MDGAVDVWQRFTGDQHYFYNPICRLNKVSLESRALSLREIVFIFSAAVLGILNSRPATSAP
ncbi:MAG: hypothetical protein ACXWT1_02645 [Methylobacter sp.]